MGRELPDRTYTAAEVDAATLVAEQARFGMFVGVAVGFEFAHELNKERSGGE
jgi:hypothetical protein